MQGKGEYRGFQKRCQLRMSIVKFIFHIIIVSKYTILPPIIPVANKLSFSMEKKILMCYPGNNKPWPHLLETTLAPSRCKEGHYTQYCEEEEQQEQQNKALEPVYSAGIRCKVCVCVYMRKEKNQYPLGNGITHTRHVECTKKETCLHLIRSRTGQLGESVGYYQKTPQPVPSRWRWSARHTVRGCGANNTQRGASTHTHTHTWRQKENMNHSANKTTCVRCNVAGSQVQITLYLEMGGF